MTSHAVLATGVSSAADCPITQTKNVLTRQARLCREELDIVCRALSHDLRAPVRSIEGFSQVVLESICEKLDAQTASYFQRVIKASQELGGLLDGLLQLTRITRHVMHKKVVDLSGMAQHVVARIRSFNPGRNVKVTIMPELCAFGDPMLLKLALEQLFENAWKFTQSQGGPEISFGGKRSETDSIFYLSDNGMGFDMAYYGRLFGVFERLHVPSDLPGHGIGLAIVKRILQRHGGTVWAKATPALGACFWFTLPHHATHETTTVHSHDRRQQQRRDACSDRAGEAACQI